MKNINLRIFLSRLGLVLAGVLLAAGLQAFAFTQPASAPTAGDVNAPINTGTSPQTRQGVLTINSGLILGAGSVTNGLIVETGNVGIGTMYPAGTLDVENSSKTATICLNGNCTTSLGSSASNPNNGLHEVVLNSSGSFTVPSGITAIKMEAWGGGGGGGFGIPDGMGSGGGSYYGGGGAYCNQILSVTPGQVLSFVIGSGGQTSTTGVGTAGGSTYGGGGCNAGGGGASTLANGSGGTASGYGENIQGGSADGRSPRGGEAGAAPGGGGYGAAGAPGRVVLWY